MIEFLTSADLWANIIGGVVAADLLAAIAFLWERRKHRIIRDLIMIMGRAIKHRNNATQIYIKNISIYKIINCK